MGELRHGVGPAESLIEQHVERRAGQPFLATDDVGDLHQMVVDDVGEVIGGQFVGTLVEHFVVEDVALDDHVAANHVVDMHLPARFYLETDGILHAVGDEPVYFLLGKRERIAHLRARADVVLEVLDFVALGFQLLGCIESDVCLALVEQPIDILLVDIAAFALPVGAVVAAEADAFIKLDAEPTERFYDVFFCSRDKTVGVRVFNSKDKFASMLACKQIVV